MRAGELLKELTGDGQDQGAEGVREVERYVAVDVEWPVKKGLSKKQAKVAVVQVATHGGAIAIFHIAVMDGRFPRSLKNLLESPKVLKVGVNIANDATRLRKDWGVTMQPIQDLGRIAHRRGLASKVRTSLQDLVALCCGAHLDKDEGARLSDWSVPLSAEQKAYAALDVFATQRVYHHAMSTQTVRDSTRVRRADELKDLQSDLVIVPAKGHPTPLARVMVVDKEGEGEWCELAPGHGTGRTSRQRHILKSKRVVVRVLHVYQPVACLMHADKQGRLGRTLQDAVGQEDYQMLVDVACIRVLAPAPLNPPPPVHTAEPPPLTSVARGPSGGPDGDGDESGEEALLSPAGTEEEEQAQRRDERVASTLRLMVSEEEVLPEGGEEVGHEAERAGEGGASDAPPAASSTSTAADDAGSGSGPPGAADGYANGRHVKQDVQHWFGRIMETVSKEHGAFSYFAARLSDCTFQVVPEDLERVKAVMVKLHGLEDDQAWRRWLNRNWWAVLKHCRRHIVEPGLLVQRLTRLKALFATIPDAKTRLPFFSATTEGRWAGFIEHAAKGCVSDPDPRSVPLYFISGWSRAGLPIYGCSRGTVDLEGYHQKIEALLEGYSVGLEQADATLREFNFRWNLAMEGKYLGMESDIKGFYELERVDAIQTLTLGWWEQGVYPLHRHSDTYAHTGEAFGLLANLHAGEGEVDGEGDRGLVGAVIPMVESDEAALLEEEEEGEEGGDEAEGGGEDEEPDAEAGGEAVGAGAVCDGANGMGSSKRGLQRSAEFYAELCGKNPCLRVETEEER